MCTLIEILLLTLLKCYLSFASSYNSTLGSAFLPDPNGRMAIGYDKHNDTILLIGGESDYMNQFVTFKNNTFTLINEQYLTTDEQIKSWAQQYTTLHDELWIIRFDGIGFITFNLNTYKVNTPSITLQTNVGKRGCLTSTSNYMIVIGGGESYDALNTAQIYDIDEGIWLQNVPTMSQQRRSLACLVVDDNAYAIGGRTDNSGTRLDTIESLDVSNMDSIQSKEWHTLQGTLSQKEDANRAVQYNTDIIVIGGLLSTGTSVSDIHLIDTLTESCELVGTLADAVSAAPSVIIGNILYIFGGFIEGDAFSNKYQYITLPTTLPTNSPTDAATEGPTEHPVRAATTNSIIVTTETLNVTDTSTSETDSVVDTTDYTTDIDTRESVSTSPFRLGSNTIWPAFITTAPLDETIANNDRIRSKTDHIVVIILVICGVILVICIVVAVLCALNMDICRGKHNRNKSVKPQEQPQMIRVVAQSIEQIQDDSNDIIQQGINNGTEMMETSNIQDLEIHNAVNIDCVVNMETIEGMSGRKSNECVDCGAMQPGKIYDNGLFYCNECFSLYIDNDIIDGPNQMASIRNVQNIKQGIRNDECVVEGDDGTRGCNELNTAKGIQNDEFIVTGDDETKGYYSSET